VIPDDHRPEQPRWLGRSLAAGETVTYTCTHVIGTQDPRSARQHRLQPQARQRWAGASKTLGLAPDTICDSAVVDVFQPGELAKGSGSKFLDANGNGTHDLGEGALSAFRVLRRLQRANSSLDAGEPAAVSAGDGTWLISGIKPGVAGPRGREAGLHLHHAGIRA